MVKKAYIFSIDLKFKLLIIKYLILKNDKKNYINFKTGG